MKPAPLFVFFLTLLSVAARVVASEAKAGEAEPGSSVAVVYNSSVRESAEVAEYYASKRLVPKAHLFGFDLPTDENITRADYLEKLERPLRQKLEDAGLMNCRPGPGDVSHNAGADSRRTAQSAQIRYLVLCYGVPVRILRDTNLVESRASELREELRRNEASVDSELAALPAAGEGPRMWAGPLRNPAAGATNAAQLHPTNGVLMVTRLDGPSAAIAKGLVDKALEAERSGLWGRAYIDARGLTNGNYLVGDQWMMGAFQMCVRAGFEAVLDTNPTTFPVSFPMSDIAIYAGWYDGGVSGPFTRPVVDFRPGAFAYHLHSFNAGTIRLATVQWVGPLLAKGATCTFGSVDEPYLVGTLALPDFFARFLLGGFSFGEAAFASQLWLSWQNVAVGDPLYRPFLRRPDALHAALVQANSPLLEWSHLRIVNLNLSTGAGTAGAITYLEKLPDTRKSAVLTEKLADLYWKSRRLTDALETYEIALKRNPTSLEKLRLLLTLARRRASLGPDRAAYRWLNQVLREYPDYPDRLGLYREMLAVARRLENPAEIKRCQEEIQKLSPPDTSGSK